MTPFRLACRPIVLVVLAASLAGANSAVAAGPGPIPQWIWSSEFPRNGEQAEFRRSFSVPAGITKAELRGLADDECAVELNGAAVGSLTASDRFATFDVAKQLRPGANEIRLTARNKVGAAGVLLKLTVTQQNGRTITLTTDQLWEARSDGGAWRAAHSGGLLGAQPWGDPIDETDDYHQWKQALRPGGATHAAALNVLPGFEVELVRSAGPEEGSWISLEFDPQGRLIVAREDKGLLRMTLSQAADATVQVETINDTLLECRGLLFAHGALYVNANNAKGLYRLRDTDGDDRFDEETLLLKTEGSVGHGRNDLALGLDDRIYTIHGNNVELPTTYAGQTSPLRRFGQDRLLPTAWDQNLFDAGVKAPVGHVLRTDAEGKEFELLTGGFRNPYGLDFNAEGELFTYDADMEWDAGAPWYRTTRVNHLASGGEHGWRQGTAVWPAWFADSLPGALDIGKGSPTGVKFGTRSQFPEPYRQALYILDWAYGRILAVHLTPQGATYSGQAELFISGRPLNVTDLAFGPDGAMYFVTGGRRTQSGLYRVRYTGPDVAAPALSPEEQTRRASAAELRETRRRLEKLHGRPNPHAAIDAWPYLDHPDRWIRTAARIAVEHQPVAGWTADALREEGAWARCETAIALARCGPPAIQTPLLRKLAGFPLGEWPVEQQASALRAMQLAIIRMGTPSEDVAERLRARLTPLYPAASFPINSLLSELLVALDEPAVIPRTLTLLRETDTQEEKLAWLMLLRDVADGWSLDQRREYFLALAEANAFHGAQSVPLALRFLRADAVATLTEEERHVLAPELALLDPPAAETTTAESRPLVKEWTAADVPQLAAAPTGPANFERGRAMFTAAQCIKCHQLGIQGSPLGPELTGVAGRFSRTDMLESILNPSKVIDEKYRSVVIETTDGRVVTGRLQGGDAVSLNVATEPLAPEKLTKILKSEIESQQDSPVSPMPAGLLNTLTVDEIRDLLAYLESRGNPRHPLYRAGPTK